MENDPTKLTINDLKLIAEILPKYPPLTPDSDVTIRDMYPNLTNDELDIVMKYYTGTMERGDKKE